jgi:hypothetical protein
MMQSTHEILPRVEPRAEEALCGWDRGPTVVVAWQAPKVVAPDCGLTYLPREAAQGKLQAMVEGAAVVRTELGG